MSWNPTETFVWYLLASTARTWLAVSFLLFCCQAVQTPVTAALSGSRRAPSRAHFGISEVLCCAPQLPTFVYGLFCRRLVGFVREVPSVPTVKEWRFLPSPRAVPTFVFAFLLPPSLGLTRFPSVERVSLVVYACLALFIRFLLPDQRILLSLVGKSGRVSPVSIPEDSASQ